MTLFSRVLSGHHGTDKPVDKAAKHLGHGKNRGENPGDDYKLTISLESPPIMLYGQPHESTGSIVSGILTLDIFAKDGRDSELHPVSSQLSGGDASESNSSGESVELESVVLSLVQTIRYTRPFVISSSTVSGCTDCSVRKSVLARWDVLTSRHSFPVGSHAYPFSHLLPGSLPQSCKLGSTSSASYIKYDLIAVAKTQNSAKEKVVKLPLNISRSILRGPDRNSHRVFPPTEMKANTVLPNVIYPKSTFPIELSINNIVSTGGERRWRMRRLNWRIEECTKIKAHCCEKHVSKLKAVETYQRKIEMNKDKKSSNSKSNAHHSTIHTGMSLSADPSMLHPVSTQNEQPNENRDEEPPEDVPNGSVVANAHSSFIEDFLQPSTSATSAVSATSATSVNSNNNSVHLDTSDAIPSTAPSSSPELNEESLYLEETRTVSHGEIKSGWKTDFSGQGRIEIVGKINAHNFSTGYNKHIVTRNTEDSNIDDNHEGLRSDANVSCDISDPSTGIFVSHLLVVEVIVAEEIIHNEGKKAHKKQERSQGLTPVASTESNISQTSQTSSQPPSTLVGVPTGAARVLRMQFRIILTERSGLGIAWDDEVPPTYENVRTLSPPNYSESSTPLIGSLSQSSSPSVNNLQFRQTPAIIYGEGETPVIGSFGHGTMPISNYTIDNALESEEGEFRL